jgi:hypothetical protein
MTASLATIPRSEAPTWKELLPMPDIQSEKEHVVMAVAGLVSQCVMLEDMFGYHSPEAAIARQKKDDRLFELLKVNPRPVTEGVARGHGLMPQGVETENPAVVQEFLATAERLTSGIMTSQEQERAQVIVDAHNGTVRKDVNQNMGRVSS